MVVVVGGVVLVVLLDGGFVVVVVGGVVVVVVGEAGGGTNVNMAVVQSVGWVATTTSTPGSAEKVQTLRCGCACRQARAGAVVVNPVIVPTNCGVPVDAGGIAGVSGTVDPFHTAVVTKPVPGGTVTDGPL